LVRMAGAELIGAGVRFDSEATNVSLFAGQSWLKEQSAPLEGHAREAETQACIPAPRECGE
jgi:hypothetical protein